MTGRPDAAVDPEAWRAVRSRVIDRDGGVCTDCGDPCATEESDVHHLVPRAAGGSDDLTNLVLLCDACHGGRHPNLQVSLSRRFLERWAVRLAKLVDFDRRLPDEMPDLGEALRALGKSRLRSGQLEPILAALRGESVLVVRSTGFGKTLCFQIPALYRSGTTFVVTPLKALMSSQVQSLQRAKVPATFINGDLNPQEKEARYDLLSQGSLKLLFVAPERFDSRKVRPAEAAQLLKQRPSFLVIDEAHTIERWGDSFRPSYGRLGQVRKELGNPPMLAFTATAGVKTQQRILSSLDAMDAQVFCGGVDRPNISLFRLHVEDPDRRYRIVARQLGKSSGRAMIFVPSIPVGKEVQEGLRKHGHDLPFYHSRAHTANERDMMLGRFLGRIQPAMPHIICTNAFGMGLDVPDVRLVVHWQHPASVEDYLQEFGRAGRDGNQSTALLFVGRRDVGRLRFMTERSLDESLPPGEREEILARKLGQLDDVAALARDASCFRRSIRAYFEGSRPASKPISIRLLEWVFAEQHRKASNAPCCDRCTPWAVQQVIAGL